MKLRILPISVSNLGVSYYHQVRVHNIAWYKFSKSPLVSEIQDPLKIYHILWIAKNAVYCRFRGGPVSPILEDFSKITMVKYHIPLSGDSRNPQIGYWYWYGYEKLVQDGPPPAPETRLRRVLGAGRNAVSLPCDLASQKKVDSPQSQIFWKIAV